MKEASKLRNLLTNEEWKLLQGDGLDIGCGDDPIKPDVRCFDIADGDANKITNHVAEQFDYVFSSHCLEHMFDPQAALLEWWQLVKPGGHLLFAVPDEDLYEQGVFPSRFNTDHKATFTLAKRRSWSPVSLNVLELVATLPGSQLVKAELLDVGYDRRLITFGLTSPVTKVQSALARLFNGISRRIKMKVPTIERWINPQEVFDQTTRPDAMAQIFCIIRKIS